MNHPPARPCLFCAIATGRAPAHIVYESPNILAFLDIAPIRTGHVQIITKEHYPYFDDLPPALAAEIVEAGQRLAKALKLTQGVNRVSFLFTGGDVPHVHAHVVPMVAPTDITSRRYIAEEKITFLAMPRLSDDELAATAHQLRTALA